MITAADTPDAAQTSPDSRSSPRSRGRCLRCRLAASATPTVQDAPLSTSTSQCRRRRHGTSRPQRSRQEHVVLPCDAAVRNSGPDISADPFGHDIGLVPGEAFATAGRGVPAAHTRPRPLSDSEPALSRGFARHRQARRSFAQRRRCWRAAELADRAGQQGAGPSGRPDATAGNRARIAASSTTVAAFDEATVGLDVKARADILDQRPAAGDLNKASACYGPRICSTKSRPAMTSLCCIKDRCLPATTRSLASMADAGVTDVNSAFMRLTEAAAKSGVPAS